jgi:hypothetical protein
VDLRRPQDTSQPLRGCLKELKRPRGAWFPCTHGYMELRNNKAPPCELGQVLVSIGAGEKSRTPDLRITNALLYQLSYAGGVKSGRL